MVTIVNPADNRDKRYRELNANFAALAQGGSKPPSVADITDASEAGKELLQAEDAAAMRLLLSALDDKDVRLSVGASGTATVRSLGSGATQAAAGNHSHTGAGIPLTGYSISGTSSAVSATDSVNVAISKLEKRIAELEAAATTP